MTWSDAGNLNNDGKGTTYVHNGLQKLIKATKADGTTYDFRYDADGLMVEAVKNATGINDVFQFIGGLKTRYVTSATEEVAELDGNRVVTKRFIPGPAIDERIAQIDANNAVKYIHGDKQNSVIALTNATGNPILRRAYGEYGETDATQMAQEGHPFGYTGRRWFTDLGLYYYRARWYDPELGTFLETDPIGSLDYINLYSYVGLNPLNATDPSGMEKQWQDGNGNTCNLVGCWPTPNPNSQIAKDQVNLTKLTHQYSNENGKALGIFVLSSASGELAFMAAAKGLGIAYQGIANYRRMAHLYAGMKFEGATLSLFNLQKNTKVINGVIPDAITANALIEIKNVGYITASGQLRAMSQAAKDIGRQFVLITTENAVLSKNAKKLFDEIIRIEK